MAVLCASIGRLLTRCSVALEKLSAPDSGVDCRTVPAEALALNTASAIRVPANADAAGWVFFGIDSGFESGPG